MFAKFITFSRWLLYLLPVFVCLGTTAIGTNNVYAQGGWTLPAGFVQEPVAQKLDGPTAFAFASDGRIFITQKSGVVRVWQNGALLPENFVGISTEVIGGDFYTGTSYPAAYRNAYFFGDYVAGKLWVMNMTSDIAGLVQISMGPDGNLYIFSVQAGTLYRLRGQE